MRTFLALMSVIVIGFPTMYIRDKASIPAGTADRAVPPTRATALESGDDVFIDSRAACEHLPVPTAPAAVPNDNRSPAGDLRDGVLTLRLVVTTATWRPDGPEGCGIEVYAFAEEGEETRVPGPLIRVPVGTEVRVALRSEVAETLWVKGFEVRPVDRLAGVRLVPGATHEFRFRVGEPGTYYYLGLPDRHPNAPFAVSQSLVGALTGALVVDPPDDAVEDRIFVLTRWTPYANIDEERRVRASAPDDFFELNTINGLSWPHTERLTVTEGTPVRWRVINPTNRVHLMHLHGFYFDVLSLGTEARDDIYPVNRRRRLVTEFLSPARTMVLEWTPQEVGNWIFHCHVVRHMTANQRLDRMPGAARAGAPSLASDATESMAGLITGVTVLPRGMAEADEAPRVERRLRLFANQRAAVFGDRPGFGFVLQQDAVEPARDSVRIPGSPLILTRGELTEIAVQNRLDRPLSVHWHGIELESYFDGVAGWSGIPATAGRAGRVAPAIAPGDSFVVRIAPPQAGTFIYHIHNEHADELASGLYGPLLVLEPGERHDPERDLVFVVAEPGPGSRRGAESAPFINGSRAPAALYLRAGDRYRFRFIGISASDFYVLWLENGEERDVSGLPGRLGVCAALEESGRLAMWRPIARDGAEHPPALRQPRTACEIDLGPGSTFDFGFSHGRPGRLTLYVRVVDSTSGELGDRKSVV